MVRDLMEDSVVTCNTRTTAAEIARLMCERNFGSLPVVEEDGAFYRIIQSVLVAHLHGNAAQISVEIGRGNVPSGSQPSFLELEEALAAIPAEG